MLTNRIELFLALPLDAIDAMSLQDLLGAKIDYKEGLQGAQFVIKDPKATSTCGCGSSFSA